ncbi:MAG: bifunctional 4-hydroxy-2-oxoglutarate aldolase/2-dehydro-3-deoxy-phosphogluconate aldolase [Verrucomicrobia bacterium]|nr:bifunctional 4-hydroxy-2-oxoglutarate aldolase/2-dehydro-3-deoxy-phosphogluconate aldolase [Verrucomicrobiota bacterium]
MRSKSEIISLLTNPGIIAVVRAQMAEQVLPLAEALIAGGVIAIEVTMTTPKALEAIREASKKLGARGLVGVGTVLDAATCRAAIAAGAEFVVSPILRPEIAAAARALDKPVMLGAYTPTEAQLAHEAGADFIKIFPSDGLGPNYIRALLAPLPHLKIIPTGIATPELVPQFIRAGCVGVGLGSLLMPTAALQQNDRAEVTRRAEEFVSAVNGARQQ